MVKHLFLVITFLSLHTLGYAASSLIDAPTLHQELGSDTLRIVDLRSSSDYEREHIPTAAHTDYSKWRVTKDGVVGMLPEKRVIQDLIRDLGIQIGTSVVLVSGTDSTDDFGKAARVYWTLKVARVADVSILDGGFKRWKKQNYETQAGRVEPQRSSYLIGAYDHSLLATQSDVAKALEDDSVLIVDARPKSFFDGFLKHQTARVGGTIYNAVNLSQFDFINDDGTLISQEKARTLYSNIQRSPPATSIISFCNTGHWAATNWFIFSEYLGEKTKLYDGSMVEWAKSKSNKMTNIKSRKELAEFKKKQN